MSVEDKPAQEATPDQNGDAVWSKEWEHLRAEDSMVSWGPMVVCAICHKPTPLPKHRKVPKICHACSAKEKKCRHTGEPV